MAIDERRIRGAWEGRISGCLLGKPVEILSMAEGSEALDRYLADVDALPLRDYVPLVEGSWTGAFAGCCRGQIDHAEPDDDINYSVLALMMLEEHGTDLTTEDVARTWLRRLPPAMTFTAEREAVKTLLDRTEAGFGFGMPAGFDVTECADNDYNDWIGAQIRADVYGWVLPGRPADAADLARRDARLSHRDEGVEGAAFVAACGAAIPSADSLDDAVGAALAHLPEGSGAADAVRLGRSLVGHDDPVGALRAEYAEMSPVHTLNNLAVVVWGLLAGEHDFGRAIGDTVAAGWDTDCNGATVGGLWGLTGEPVPEPWTAPWQGRVEVTIAGVGELTLDDLVERTVGVATDFSTATRATATG